jgi:hypothetical protein
MLIASIGVAFGLFLIVLAAMSATTGQDELNLPSEIELVYPREGDTILRQETISIDLIPGYTGVIEIDGIRLPTDQVETSANVAPGDTVPDVLSAKFDPGTNRLTYQPRTGAPIEQFNVGTHDILVIYWRMDQGPERAYSYRSTFKVTL